MPKSIEKIYWGLLPPHEFLLLNDIGNYFNPKIIKLKIKIIYVYPC